MNRQWRVMLVTLLLAGGAACSSADREKEQRLAELQAERRSLLMQFSSTQNAIRRIQASALQEEGVRTAQDTFNARLRAVVARDDPESVALLDRAQEVGQGLEEIASPVILQQGQEDPRPNSDEERAQLAAELAETERALRPVIDAAFQDPSVLEAFGALRDSVAAAMLRIDPGTQVSMDRMAELESQIVVIDAEIAGLSEQ